MLLFIQAQDAQKNGRFKEAEELYRKIIAQDSRNFDALHMLGIVCFENGKESDSERFFQKAMKVDANFPPLFHNYGLVLARLKRYQESVRQFERAIKLFDKFAPAYSDRGISLLELGRLDESLASHNTAVALAPNVPNAFYNRGNTLIRQKNFDAALHDYDKAVALHPGYADAHCGRGNVHLALKRYEAASAAYDKALALKPDLADAWLGRGNMFFELKRYGEALAAYDRVLAFKPDAVEGWLGRGNVFRELARSVEALAAYDKALALKPDLAEAWLGRGNVCFAQNRDAEALRCYDKATALKSDMADAYLGKALVRLSLGDCRTGWELYEWRWKSGDFASRVRNFSQPLWLGDNGLSGKTILVHSEQGYGDTVQFCRYLSRLQNVDCKVVFETMAPLAPLFMAQDIGVPIVVRGEALPHFDVHCPLMSLPLAFKETLETIPSAPYIRPSEDKAAAWRDLLGEKTRPRIGLVWSGNPSTANDIMRGIPLKTLASIATETAEWFSLQKDVRDPDRASLAAHPAIKDHTGLLRDFSETAALISALDLVISVDTAVAHLAGALGKRVWILLAHHSDFRWLRERDDSPWYPTARLFRQAKDGDWAGVIDRVSQELKLLSAGETQSSSA
jgi:tetratricopeptide (TPR) repeat protein